MEAQKKKLWLVCIDLPFWISAIGKNHSDWLSLQSIFDDIAEANMQLLYRNELIQQWEISPDKCWILLKKLSSISTCHYASDESPTHIKSTPDLLTSIVEDKLKKEISYQTVYLYQRKSTLPRPLISTSRFDTELIKLAKDKKNPRNVYVCGTNNSDVKKIAESLLPTLFQDKHFMFERKIGKGKIASTFSAFDKNNTKPAEELLMLAFQNYDGEELPASSLWVWDDKHYCYVQFMHSGQNQYHGHDEKNPQKAPTQIRKIYGK